MDRPKHSFGSGPHLWPATCANCPDAGLQGASSSRSEVGAPGPARALLGAPPTRSQGATSRRPRRPRAAPRNGSDDVWGPVGPKGTQDMTRIRQGHGRDKTHLLAPWGPNLGRLRRDLALASRLPAARPGIGRASKRCVPRGLELRSQMAPKRPPCRGPAATLKKTPGRDVEGEVVPSPLSFPSAPSVAPARSARAKRAP